MSSTTATSTDTRSNSAAAFDKLLQEIRDNPVTERDKGTDFENISLNYFRYEPFYQERYEKVLSFKDWFKEYGSGTSFTSAKDVGIDLVAVPKGTSLLPAKEQRFHAIQCKCYAKDHTVQKKDIDSFFTASGKSCFDERFIVTANEKWSNNAWDATQGQTTPVSVITLKELRESKIDWNIFYRSEEKTVEMQPKKSLREHQKAAFDAVTARLIGDEIEQDQSGIRAEYFAHLKALEAEHHQVQADLLKADQKAENLLSSQQLTPPPLTRGKLLMACGTGKTFTSLKIAEQLAGSGKTVLFLVPSLALLSQTVTEWTQESETPISAFAVCSDAEVGKKKSNENDASTKSDLEYPATTNANALAMRFARARQADNSTMTVIFSTYHSIDVIHQAQADYDLPPFDLVVCDEAHRTTGVSWNDQSKNTEDSNFIRIHDNQYIQARKRLYMTATPRIYDSSSKKDEEATVYSMDDLSNYGEDLYTISFAQAVEKGLLVDYKVLVLTVPESDMTDTMVKYLKESGMMLSDDMAGDDDGYVVPISGHVDPLPPAERKAHKAKTDTHTGIDAPTKNIHDICKIIGSWKALSQYHLDRQSSLEHPTNPLKRAVAFCQVIGSNYKSKFHKVSSKQIAASFHAVSTAYQALERDLFVSRHPDTEVPLNLQMNCTAYHVDGGMGATEKTRLLNWLKEEPGDGNCRVLTNVRCLSEGVDVPALDAVLFLTPRSSQVDIVQSVGRVMRISPGKKIGYVVIPVVIPAGKAPEEVLASNPDYQCVWKVVNALRSHDERLENRIAKGELLDKPIENIEIIDMRALPQKPSAKKPAAKNMLNDQQQTYQIDTQSSLELQLGNDLQNTGEVAKAIYATIVKKCGNRMHWDDWASDVAKIAQNHIDYITSVLSNPEHVKEKAAFEQFAKALRADLNDQISDNEIIEMLAQHLITKPVFNALFSGHEFTKHNPISKAMQHVIDAIDSEHLMESRSTLQAFYESVEKRASGIDSALGKQKIVVELYDKFFRNAFPKMTKRLGIVYTPVEVVDFIIHSVNDVLKKEFQMELKDSGVHILDPFTGTGTFITRLLQSGLIPPSDLPYKYHNEIHANEIVLLAYYIAAINIETTYFDLIKAQANDLHYVEALANNKPFSGICLTDTFQMSEHSKSQGNLEGLEEMAANNERVKLQRKLDVRVIIGNPPYSAGQKSGNDNNQNLSYPVLDNKIAQTYLANSTTTLKKNLYDSYIRAIRWASDRIGDRGIIGFVTNAGFVDNNVGAGIRACLAEEFSNLYFFHLRGDLRPNGAGSEYSRKESDNVFEQGTRTPVVISILVKNPDAQERGQIFFHRLGDYLSREKKLSTIAQLGSIQGIAQLNLWQRIVPDNYHDWLHQRDPNFNNYYVLGDKKDASQNIIFELYSLGVKTNRDAWCYNSSKKQLSQQVERMIKYYNGVVPDFQQRHQKEGLSDFKLFMPKPDSTCFKWDRSQKEDLLRNKSYTFNQENIRLSLYRPFQKQFLYYSREVNNCIYQTYRCFPQGVSGQVLANRVICVTGISAKAPSVFISNITPDQNLLAGGTQCFPLYRYEPVSTSKNTQSQDSLFSSESEGEVIDGYRRSYAITDEALAHFQSAYTGAGEQLNKEDLFYYIYGLLNSPEYREKNAVNLTKNLPHIPRCKRYKDFLAFSLAGRELADLHVNYEEQPLYTTGISLQSNTLQLGLSEGGILPSLKVANAKVTEREQWFRVEKMKFLTKDDHSTIVYNGLITIKGIPEEAYDFIVNGKSAIEWVMERQAVTKDTKKDSNSGIVNDANTYANETVGRPEYPLELLLRVITVSLETQKIIKQLPALDFLPT